MTDGWYMLVSHYASAGVLVRGDYIREAASIYRKFIGKNVTTFPQGYKFLSTTSKEVP